MNGSVEFTSLIPTAHKDAAVDEWDVGGIALRVFGLSRLTGADAKMPCRVIFCLHGRQSTAHEMDAMCRAYAGRSRSRDQLPIVAVAFDQRNHGGRLVREQGNCGWTGATRNPMHAVDMYSIQRGTALDVSFLIDQLPARFEVDGRAPPVAWGVSGISLGAHASFIAGLNDPRIDLIIGFVGCGDYETLMRGRYTKLAARKPEGELPPWHVAFPPSLAQLVRRVDPVHRVPLLLHDRGPRALPRVQFLGGGRDTLVPVDASAGFWAALEAVYRLAGVADERLSMVTDPDAAHDCSLVMAKAALAFLAATDDFC
ncbi:hypothetical protein H9P43_001671 [Blastocladiella emersonii ATCC 22665]|nr:hypothetical protein H9P43_001671 [Blastocladiella emersonii ATCC 22665]